MKKAQHKERWRQQLLRVLRERQELVQQYNVPQKKSVVMEFTRYGCKPEDISKASGYSLAFVYDTVEEFAHHCLVDRVKETTNVQPQD
jgi:hypothetical protein